MDFIIPNAKNSCFKIKKIRNNIDTGRSLDKIDIISKLDIEENFLKKKILEKKNKKRI